MKQSGWPYDSGAGLKPTKRIAVASALLVAFAVLPPVLGRTTDLLEPHRALVVGIAICYAAMALSLNLLLGYTGQITLGHGAFLGIGAFASGIITSRGEGAMILGLLGAVVAGAAFAFLIGLPALRLRGLYLAIATIGFAFMMEESLFRWTPLTGGSAGIEMPRPYAGTFQFTQNADFLAILLVLLLGIWLLDQNVVRTKLGRAFRAIRSDESVAQAFGVNVARYKLLAFVLSGALAGVAGAMYGHLIGFVNSETFAFKAQPNFSLLLVIIVVIGGLGSRVGVVVAAIAYAYIPELMRSLEGWELIIGSVLLIDLMARNPRGLAGAIKERREARAEKKARAATDDQPEEEEIPKLPALPRPAGLEETPASVGDVPLLEVEGLSVAFGGLQALNGVDLAVPRGQIIGLIGPNGAGKTTLFNAASGFVRPDEGAVRFLGTDITRHPPHERVRLGIGRTFQLIGLASDMTVLENFLLAQHVVARYDIAPALFYPPSVKSVEDELKDRGMQAIEALGFERFANTPVRNLSHGQQRLVELGCSLVTAPELLLLDEPSAGMAPGAAENLADRLRDIRDDLGRTILLIEHHVPMVLDVCDYIYVLNFGEVLAHGSTDEIAERPEVIGAYFGEAVA